MDIADVKTTPSIPLYFRYPDHPRGPCVKGVVLGLAPVQWNLL